jgi:uncharacterized membrane protein YheB (UPF0754 family)
MLTWIVEQTQPHLGSILEIDGLVVDMLSGENANRLAQLFRALGEREFRFLIWYGAILGFIVGAVEVGVYIPLERWWLLPLVGALDGLVNNWAAIQMIFRPLEPVRYLGLFPYQGLFPARQKDIAKNYAHMVANEVLTIDNLSAHMSQGDTLNRLLPLIGPELDRHLSTQLHQMAVFTDPLARTAVIPAAVLPVVAAHLRSAIEPTMPTIKAYVGKRLDLAGSIEERLAAMPKAEFERVLRGIFEEDEAVLIILGGVIGSLIGLLQAAVIVTLGLA